MSSSEMLVRQRRMTRVVMMVEARVQRCQGRGRREGGARVARDSIVVGGVSKPLVYNYGAGGTGFQAGYGMALDAVRAAEPLLSKIQVELKSKL